MTDANATPNPNANANTDANATPNPNANANPNSNANIVLNSKNNLLLVEDSSFMRKTMRDDLIRFGYNVKIMETGESAVQFIKDNDDISLILMDIELGKGIDGTEAAKQILKIREIPIIFLTSHKDESIVKKTDNISSYGYVMKSSGIAVIDASIKMAYRLYDSKLQVSSLLTKNELLLNEVNHRIKNNMTVISNILAVEACRQSDDTCKKVLEDCSSRVVSMMVLYDFLYRNKISNDMSIKDYIDLLIKDLVKVYNNIFSIDIQLNIQDIKLNPKIAASLGLIINEMFTNAVKYAFENIKNPTVKIHLFQKNNDIIVIFKDNGKGLPEKTGFENSTSFGLKLIGMLVREIRGKIKINRESGTEYVISFQIT